MAKKTEKMTEEELAVLCYREFDGANEYMNEIADDRKTSIEYYNQDPFGNEEDGLSAYVSSDVRDTIEWALPQLVDIFVGGDTPVAFLPENEQDVQAAENETRYVQYVFQRQNKAVIIVYSWFKDALMQKNGIVRAEWDEKTQEEREEYKNKTSAEYIAIQNDPEVEIKEVTICIDEKEYSQAEYAEILQAVQSDPSAGPRIDADAYYNFVAMRKKNIGQVLVENIPPENFYIRKGHNSIFVKDAEYCCEVFEKTRNQLLEMGFEREMVESLPSGQTIFLNDEKNVRFEKEGGSLPIDNTAADDPMRQMITLYRHYIKTDFDQDGIAETRVVITAGTGGKYVLENEPVDRNPFHAITPYINTHKFFGRSMADNMVDLQRAKSQLWRNGFDNVMYSAIPRKIVSGNVNADDLLSFIPGGIIRKDAAATVENDVVPFVAGDVFPMIDRLDGIRGERTGFSSQTMGLDPAALANSTNMVGSMILSQSQLLIKMIATIFAHSGFEELMLHIRELVMKNEKATTIFDLTGQFLQTNPRDWRNQRKTECRVGIGYAGKQEAIATFNQLLTTQNQFMTLQQGVNGPLTNAAGVFNTIKRICSIMNIKDAGTYFQDPETYQAPAPPPPSLAEIQTKAGVEKMNADIKGSDADRAIKIQQMNNDHEYKIADLAQTERLKTKELENTRALAEQELIYKYGSDAHDRAAKTLGAMEDRQHQNDTMAATQGFQTQTAAVAALKSAPQGDFSDTPAPTTPTAKPKGKKNGS